MGLLVLIDTNENIHDKVKSTVMIEVRSSIILVSALLAICKELITKRQNPKRFADVFRICWDVLFATLYR